MCEHHHTPYYHYQHNTSSDMFTWMYNTCSHMHAYVGLPQQQSPETCSIMDDWITTKSTDATVCTGNELCTSIQCNISIDPATNLIDTETVTFDPCTEPPQITYMYTSRTTVIADATINETVTLELRINNEINYATLVLNYDSTGINFEVSKQTKINNNNIVNKQMIAGIQNSNTRYQCRPNDAIC